MSRTGRLSAQGKAHTPGRVHVRVPFSRCMHGARLMVVNFP